MSLFVYLLVGIHMSGQIEPLYLFERKYDCQQAIVVAQSISEKPAHLACLKILINEV